MEGVTYDAKGQGLMARIAVLPGDGIGPEVVGEGLRVLRRAMVLDAHLELEFDEFA
jgi:tartrate dehydrogenase/decarboxylase / D-malate dehydrogenase